MSDEIRPLPRWLVAALPSDEAERLKTLVDYEILDTAPEAVFDNITWLATYICRTPMATVTLIDADRQWFKSRIGMENSEAPRDEAICAHTILQPDRVFEVQDTTVDDRFADNPCVTGGPSIRFYAGAPLVSEKGHAVGTLCVMDRQPRVLSGAQREALRILASQVASELELRRRLNIEKDRLAQLVGVVDAVPCGFLIRDRSGSFSMKNAAAGRYFKGNDPVAEGIELLNSRRIVMPPTQWPGVRALAGENVVEEMIVRQPGGIEMPVVCTAVPMRDSRGTIVAAAIAYQDVTPIAEIARLKNEFVSTVSHELRTPLTAIKGSLQLVHADEGISDDHRELIGVALGSADRLIRMVNDILDAAKIEAGKLKLQRRTLTVGELARTAVENVRSIAAAAGVRLAIDIEPDVRAIHVDVDRMVQAIVNLLGNAIKFAPRATTVVFAARRMPDGGVSMTVQDQGSGIPAERFHRLFEKFSQLQPGSTNQRKGTGLGLAITKGIVEEHGGSIHVVSSPEEGTTFEIRLHGDGTSFAPGRPAESND